MRLKIVSKKVQMWKYKVHIFKVKYFVKIRVLMSFYDGFYDVISWCVLLVIGWKILHCCVWNNTSAIQIRFDVKMTSEVNFVLF